MMKRLLAMLLLLCLFPALVLAEEAAPPVVVDLINHPETEWAFADGAKILEVLFPRVIGADACFLRYDGKVLLVDAGTPGQHDRIADALDFLGIDHVDTGFNSHPHDDHIGGFDVLNQSATLGELYITFPEDYNRTMENTMKAMKAQGVPVKTAVDSDLIPFGDVRLEVIQRSEYWFPDNDASAMLRLDYGDRSMMLTADVSIAGQNSLLKTTPEKLDVDVFKYPHHGVGVAGWNFLTHLSPEFGVVTNNHYSKDIKDVLRDAKRRNITLVLTEYGMVRLRTDGCIWVVDQLPMDE